MRSPLLIFIILNINIYFLYNKLFSEVNISKFSVTDKGINIFLSSEIPSHINLKNIIFDGLTVKVIYIIYLYEKKSFLIVDELITNFYIYFEIKQDYINNGFKCIHSYGKNTKQIWFYNYNKLIDFITTIEINSLFDNDLLEKDKYYYLEVQQKIVSLEIYPPLSLIYNILGKWNYVSKRTRTKLFDSLGVIYEIKN